MTKPRYQSGCSAGSQVRGRTLPPAGNAFIVSLNNGNANINDQRNHYGALACRPGECQDAVSFRRLHTALSRTRRRKTPSFGQLGFDARRSRNLLGLERDLLAGDWRPAAPTCFVAHAPKRRQIHAPPYRDRVVHHLAIPVLEAEYEPTFICDSYSNRKGKGTHAAVRRLQGFVRQVESGQGGGYYLQLDIKNFFNSIDRRLLYAMLRKRMERAGIAEPIRRIVHALLTWPLRRTGVRWACSPEERELVPAHKRLENAAPGCGLAVGNLSSQFFANVFLDPLDQFVKHVLKAKRYLRYVDDFVLVHESRAQLEAWRLQIIEFLRTELRLELKADQRLRPLQDGIDFLGYIVRPSHTVVRPRVIAHCRAKLAQFEQRRGFFDAARIRSTWASYAGHFRHASTYRLQQRIHARFPWLAEVLA